MKMRKFSLLLLFALFLLLPSCAHVISSNLREKADPTLTLQRVLKSPPQQYNGKFVVWGGEILQTTNQQDGSTLIEVLQRSIDWWDEPIETSASEGRFLVRMEEFLDPVIYSARRKITVAGEIQGEEERPLGAMRYRYPVILGKQIYLWPLYSYPPYYYPGYYTFWYPYPYYYPWGPRFYGPYHH